MSKGLVPWRTQEGKKKKNHQGRWLGIFQPDRKESAHLGKMTKGKAAKRWNLEDIEKVRTKVSHLGPPITRKSARDF